MDIQEWVDMEIKKRRENRMLTSDQLTLGAMIEKMELIVANQDVGKSEKSKVRYDFDYLFPTDLHSWRGSYDELALNFKSEGEQLTCDQFLSMLKNAVGKHFTGYKGGEFLMGKNTPVWVAKDNHSGNTAVVDIVDNNYQIVIMTAFREY